MPSIARRHLWPAELLDIGPSDRVLEVGCGHGLATGAMLSRLAGGELVAVDRSDKMTAACAQRNDDAVASGALRVATGDFENLGLTGFDKAFAVNVDFPLHADRGWVAAFRKALKPDGRLALVLEAPALATAERFGAAASAELDAGGFTSRIVVDGGLVAVVAQ